MGDVVIKLHLNDLGVDHEEAKILRTRVVEKRGNDCVNADSFTRSGGTCNEKVRHFREVVYKGATSNFFT